MLRVVPDSEEQRRALTFSVKDYANPKKRKEVRFFHVLPEGGLGVPRFQTQEPDPPDPKLLAEQAFPAPAPSFALQLQQTPRRPQRDAEAAAVRQLREHGGGIIVLPCGTGKTIVAIKIAVGLGVRTAVVCHSNFLLEQWASRISTATGGTARIGRLQQDTEDVEGKHFVLCSMQSVLSRDYGGTDFGLLIFDEAHHIAAPTYSRVMGKLRAGMTLGLTATPNRKDGLRRVIHMLLGPPCFSLTPPSRPDVQVTMIKYTEGFQPTIKYRNGSVGISRMITGLAKDGKRNATIVRAVRRMMRAWPERKGLLLSDRVSHLLALHKVLGAECSAVVTGKINTDPGFSFRKFLTLSTFAMFAEGADFTGDFVVLSTPRTNVEQCTGRILRGRNKGTRPVILDLFDPYGVFLGMSRARRKYYEKRGYEICDVKGASV